MSDDEAGRRRALRKRILIALKIGVSVTLIAWVASKADWPSLRSALSRASVGLLAAAAGVHLVSYLLLNLRWWLLLRWLVPSVQFRETVAAFWLGLFGNNLLPSGMGGDLFRILRMRSEQMSGKDLLASVVTDRVVGLAGVLVIGAAALTLWVPPSFASWWPPMLVSFLILLPVGFLLASSTWAVRLVSRWQQRFRQGVVMGNALATIRRLQRYRLAWRVLVAALLLTVLLQGLVAACYALLGRAVGTDLPVVTFFVVIPILFIIVNLPISVGGLGVREGALIALLSAAGGDTAEAAAIGLLYLGVLLALTLPGGLVLFLRRDPRKEATDLEPPASG